MPHNFRGTLLLAAACAAFGAPTVLIAAPAAAAPHVQLVSATPSVGDPCSGAEIGRRTTDANGRAIICDQYRWTYDVGQRPRHPWADDQNG